MEARHYVDNKVRGPEFDYQEHTLKPLTMVHPWGKTIFLEVHFKFLVTDHGLKYLFKHALYEYIMILWIRAMIYFLCYLD